jgi:hypothetical protein
MILLVEKFICAPATWRDATAANFVTLENMHAEIQEQENALIRSA